MCVPLNSLLFTAYHTICQSNELGVSYYHAVFGTCHPSLLYAKILRSSDLQIFWFSDREENENGEFCCNITIHNTNLEMCLVGFFTISIHLLMFWSTEIYGNHVHLYKELCTYHQDQSSDVSSEFLASTITASNLDLAVWCSLWWPDVFLIHTDHISHLHHLYFPPKQIIFLIYTNHISHLH